MNDYSRHEESIMYVLEYIARVSKGKKVHKIPKPNWFAPGSLEPRFIILEEMGVIDGKKEN